MPRSPRARTLQDAPRCPTIHDARTTTIARSRRAAGSTAHPMRVLTARTLARLLRRSVSAPATVTRHGVALGICAQLLDYPRVSAMVSRPVVRSWRALLRCVTRKCAISVAGTPIAIGTGMTTTTLTAEGTIMWTARAAGELAAMDDIEAWAGMRCPWHAGSPAPLGDDCVEGHWSRADILAQLAE